MGNARLNARFEEIWSAAAVLEEEGAVAREGLGEIASDNLDRAGRRWAWAVQRRTA